MKKSPFYILAFLFGCSIVAACGPSQAELDAQGTEIAANIFATQTASAPTPTLTPISLEDTNLEGILILDGDLPAGFSGAQLRSPPDQGSYPELAKAVNMIFQQFARDGEGAGGVSIYIFDSLVERDDAFDAIVTSLEEAEPLEEVGERAAKWSIFLPLVGGLNPLEASEVVFVRCHSLATIRMTRERDLSGAISYAMRLDQRLQELTCR